MAELADEDQVIFLSDHGFTTLKQEVYLNVWLEQEGYLSFVDGAERGLQSMNGTRAFSLDPGRIYVNLAGREAAGVVPPTEAAALIDELAARLKEIKDPSNGQPVVKEVYRPDDVYHGPFRRRAPDLLAMPFDGYDLKGTFDARVLFGRDKLVGMHKYDNATLFVRGHRLTTGHASVHDVLPTACALLGLACPEDVDGRAVAAA
jgi:predicted AlkP superfamily phosphohydrolase/phosphomutase